MEREGQRKGRVKKGQGKEGKGQNRKMAQKRNHTRRCGSEGGVNLKR